MVTRAPARHPGSVRILRQRPPSVPREPHAPRPSLSDPRAGAAPRSLGFHQDDRWAGLLSLSLSGSPPDAFGGDPGWPAPADAVLTPAGLALLREDVHTSLGEAQLISSRGPALLGESEVPDALAITLMQGFDFGVAVLGLADDGRTVTGFETLPPEAKTRMFETLVELGLVQAGARARFGPPERPEGQRGSVQDQDGDGAVSPADFEGVVPIRPEAAAQALTEAALAEDAQVILLGEHHGVGPKAHAAALVEALEQAGKEVVFGVELPDGAAWKAAEAVLDEGPLTEAGAARFESALVAAFTELAAANGQAMDAEELRRALAPFMEMVLRANRAGATVRFIDGEAENRDAHMAEHVQGALAERPGAIFVGLVGLEHAVVAGQTAAPGAVDVLGTDRGAPLGFRLEEALGGPRVLSCAFLPFGQAQDKSYGSWDRVFAVGAW